MRPAMIECHTHSMKCPYPYGYGTYFSHMMWHSHSFMERMAVHKLKIKKLTNN